MALLLGGGDSTAGSGSATCRTSRVAGGLVSNSWSLGTMGTSAVTSCVNKSVLYSFRPDLSGSNVFSAFASGLLADGWTEARPRPRGCVVTRSASFSFALGRSPSRWFAMVLPNKWSCAAYPALERARSGPHWLAAVLAVAAAPALEQSSWWILSWPTQRAEGKQPATRL